MEFPILSRGRLHWPVLALALVHLLLAVWFAGITPYRTPGHVGRAPVPDVGAPDEVAHASYIQGLLNGQGLPVLDIAKMDSDKEYRATQYENHQPPLYYAVEAAWCKVAGITDVADPSLGVKIRFPNALIGALTVMGVYFAAWWGFQRRDLALAAALFPALLPMNVALSGALTNDPLLFALMAWTMALVARAVRQGWRLKLAIGVGVLAGLGILTKSTALALLPVLLIALFVPQVAKPRLTWVVAAVVPILVLAEPWLARNQREYHDPLGSRVFNLAFKDNPHKSDMLQLTDDSEFGYWTNWVGWWTARSFVGVFGYSDIFLNETGTSTTKSPEAPNTLYRVCLAGFAVLAIGWLLSLQTEWARAAKGVTIVNATLLLVVAFLFLTFNNQFFQGQARYLYPAFVPLGIGFGSGIIQFGKAKPKVAVGLAGTFLLALTVYAGIRLPSEFEKRTQPLPQFSNSGSGQSVQ